MDCCVTSPPYYALRDYGTDGQIGREATPEEYVSRITAVFHEVKAGAYAGGYLLAEYRGHLLRHRQQSRPPRPEIPQRQERAASGGKPPRPRLQAERPNRYSVACKPLPCGATVGICAVLSFGIRGNPMPESTRDRPTRCYEYVFLLTKSKKYFYDWQAVAEPIALTTAGRLKSGVSKGNKYNVTVSGAKPTAENQPPPRKGAYRR